MSSTDSPRRIPSRGPRRRARLRQDLGVDNDSALALLTEAAAERQRALDAEARLLVVASRWALLHVATAEQGPDLPGREGAAEVAGDGAPLVAEFCLAELGAAIGVSTDAARTLLGDAVELAHRLPQTWSRLCAGQVTPWRARRIAAKTAHLSAEAAAHVDEVVHPVADRIGPAALEGLLSETVARFDPERAAAEAAATAETRRVDVRVQPRWRTDGMSDVTAVLDHADARDLECRVAEIAHDLLTLHPEEPLDVRRALALGYLARGQEVPAPSTPATRARAPRRVVMHLHLHEGAVRGARGLARLEEGQLVVDADRVRAWLDVPEARVEVKPVVDLAAALHTEAHEIPDRFREQAVLRDLSCVFPWCGRAARGCDVDHVVPYGPGATQSDNLACLCRRHHRLKTHGGWRYEVIEPGRYVWTSPHGLRLLRDRHGTRLLE